MTTERVSKLLPGEIELARHLWSALRRSIPDAHDQLNAAPENVQMAVLQALTQAMEKRKTPFDPFG